MRFLARLSFCGMPLFCWVVLLLTFDLTVGGICAIAGFWVAWVMEVEGRGI